MNQKIWEAMQANKIFQMEGKFFRKTEEGQLQEMQQVKSEEIVSKGSRKFLRTIMKFIPKQIYLGELEGVDSQTDPGEGASGDWGRVMGQEASRSIRAKLEALANGEGATTDYAKKTIPPTKFSENELEGGLDPGRQTLILGNERTSVDGGFGVRESLTKRAQEETETESKSKTMDIPEEHKEYFKSTQSIYQQDKPPAREPSTVNEPIQETESDLQVNESLSQARETLFGEEPFRDSRNINEYQIQCMHVEGDGSRPEHPEEGSYVQVPTRGSETLENGLDRYSYPKARGHGKFVFGNRKKGPESHWTPSFRRRAI